MDKRGVEAPREGEWELARWLVEEEVEALNEQHLEDGCGGPGSRAARAPHRGREM